MRQNMTRCPWAAAALYVEEFSAKLVAKIFLQPSIPVFETDVEGTVFYIAFNGLMYTTGSVRIIAAILV